MHTQFLDTNAGNSVKTGDLYYLYLILKTLLEKNPFGKKSEMIAFSYNS